MTIEKARKLLGKTAIKMTDEEIEEYLYSCSAVCNVLLDIAIEKVKKISKK